MRKKFYLIIFLLIFIGFKNYSFAQTWPDNVSPNIDNGYQAYRTAGVNNPGEFNDWTTQVQWQVWDKDTWKPAVNPLYPPFDTNQKYYIEISQPHKVVLNSNMNYKNQTILVICGDLVVNSLNLAITVPLIYNENIVDQGSYFSFRANYDSDFLVTEYGVYFAPIDNDIYTQGEFYTFSFPITPGLPPAIGGEINFEISKDIITNAYSSASQFQFLFYATNEAGIGTSFDPLFKDLVKSLIKFGEKDISIMNNLTLILCNSESSFMVQELQVGNNAVLDINGAFYVETITSSPQASNVGPCICSSGSGTGILYNPFGMGEPDWDPVPTLPANIQFGGPGCNNCNQTNRPPVILPIELLSFTPDIKPDRILLNWTTGTEINNDYFTIERSRDLYGWEVLGFVPGAGNSSVPLSYSFSDLRPLDGLAYYRLKQTDFDGKFKYYGPIAAHYDLGMEGLDFKVLKQYTNWVIAVPNDGVYQVEVYNLMGHRLVSEKIENTITIPAPEGAVVIRVTDGFSRSASRVVM